MLLKAALLFAPVAYGAVHEYLEGLPEGWTQSSYALSDSQQMQMEVAL